MLCVFMVIHVYVTILMEVNNNAAKGELSHPESLESDRVFFSQSLQPWRSVGLISPDKNDRSSQRPNAALLISLGELEKSLMLQTCNLTSRSSSPVNI